MKKVLAVLVILVLLGMSCVALSENMTKQYEIILTGKWQSMGYVALSSESSFNRQPLTQMIYFTFPEGKGEYKLSGDGKTDEVWCFACLTGDETGLINLSLSIGLSVLVGRVTISSDHKRMNIETADGATFFFSRDN